MRKTKDRIDLTRTCAAIEAYDAFDLVFKPEEMSYDDAITGFKKLESLGEAVGYAFGLDTADRNSLDTCRATIRPGHKVPGPGCELSFVRRLVQDWKG